nr:hypothetical protein [Tanacetum cinerariifolium]
MDVKSAFLYETIKEDVYVCQPPGFEDPDYPDKGYKVVKVLYGLYQAPRAWYETLANYLLENGFQRGKIDQTLFIKKQKGLQVKQKDDRIFISQDKYVAELLRKFGFIDVKSASTPIETGNPLLKDPDGEDVDVHINRKFGLNDGKSASTPIDTEKHLLKDLDVAYLDSDYAGASLDRKSTTGGCQFFGCRLISWQCKKQTVVDTSSTEAEYVAAASCCAQYEVLGKDFACYNYLNSPCCSNEELASPTTNGYWLIVTAVSSKFLLFGKKVIITEATVREALRLDDAESIDCLPNEEIFKELSRMGYENPSSKLTFYKEFFLEQWKFLIHTILQCMSAKKTSGNEFSSFMASAVICLSTAQVGYLSSHTIKYSSPVLTQKVFANIRRVEKGFYEVETPLFEGMLVPQQATVDVDDVVADSVPIDDVAVNVPAADAELTPLSPPATTTTPPPQELPSTSQVVPTLPPSPISQPSSPPQQQQPSQPTTIPMDLLNNLLETYTVMDNQEDASKQGEIIANINADKDVTLKDVAAVVKEVEVKEDADVQGSPKLSQAQIYKIDLEHANKVLSMQGDESEPAELKEVVITAKLMTEVVTVAAVTITAATTPITAATITTAPSAARRRKGVVIRDPEETATPSTVIHTESKSKDKGKWIMVEEPKPLKKQAQIEQDEAYARELEAELSKNINWDDVIKQMNYFKGMSYDDIRPIFEKYFNSNVDFLEKSKEELEEEESRALQKKTKSSEEKAVKKQKLNEEIVKDRFASSKPKNFSNDFLLTTLTYKFEKPDIEDDLAGKEKISINKVHFGLDDE